MEYNDQNINQYSDQGSTPNVVPAAQDSKAPFSKENIADKGLIGATADAYVQGRNALYSGAVDAAKTAKDAFVSARNFGLDTAPKAVINTLLPDIDRQVSMSLGSNMSSTAPTAPQKPKSSAPKTNAATNQPAATTYAPTMTPNIPNISPESFGAQLLGIGDMSKPQAFMPGMDTLSYQNPQANQSATVSGLSKVAAPGVDVASIAEQFNAPDARYNIVPSAQTQAQQAGTGGQNGNAPMSDADLKLYGQFLDSDDAYSRSVVGLIQDQGMNVQQAMRYQDKLNAEARAMSANQAAPVDYKRDMQQVLLEAKKTGNPSIIAAAIQQQGQMRNAMLQDLRGTEQTDMRARTGIVQSEQQKLDRYEQAQAQQAQAQASAQQQALKSMFERQRMADEMALAQRGQQLKEVDTQARLWQMFNQKPQQQKLEYLDPSSFMSQPDSPYAQKGAFINPYTRELLPVLQGQQPTANNENTG